MDFLGVIGLLLALALLIVLVFKGYHVIPVSVLVSLVAIVFNRVDIWTVMTEGYAVAMRGFVGNYLIMFVLGAVLGEALKLSGAGTAIAVKLTDIFGKDKAILIVLIASIVLSYGGVSVFVIVFSVYPIALVLFQQANLPRRLIPGIIMLGAGAFSMTTMPGTPALTNVIPTRYLGTTLMAAPVMSIITSVVMFVSGYILQTRYAASMVKNGETFKPGPNDVVFDLTPENIAKLPSFGASILPIAAVIGIIFGERFLKTGADAVFVVWIGLLAGVLLTYGLFWNRIEDKKTSISTGTNGATGSIMNTAAVVGFGGTVRMVPAFQYFTNMVMNLPFNPIISAAVGVGIIAGITGSSSAGITIFMDSMAADFVAAGVNVEALHRIAAISAGVLDSLPHGGPNITFLSYTNLTFKEGYPGIFISTCIVPFIGVCTAILLYFVGIV